MEKFACPNKADDQGSDVNDDDDNNDNNDNDDDDDDDDDDEDDDDDKNADDDDCLKQENANNGNIVAMNGRTRRRVNVSNDRVTFFCQGLFSNFLSVPPLGPTPSSFGSFVTSNLYQFLSVATLLLSLFWLLMICPHASFFQFFAMHHVCF